LAETVDSRIWLACPTFAIRAARTPGGRDLLGGAGGAWGFAATGVGVGPRALPRELTITAVAAARRISTLARAT
jgi:hypothetical protein